MAHLKSNVPLIYPAPAYSITYHPLQGITAVNPHPILSSSSRRNLFFYFKFYSIPSITPRGSVRWGTALPPPLLWYLLTPIYCTPPGDVKRLLGLVTQPNATLGLPTLSTSPLPPTRLLRGC
eukprot:745812-Hanusia_phi.AAC.2